MVMLGWSVILSLGAIVILILYLSLKMNPKNLYYSLATLGSLLGMIISYGTSLTTWATNNFPQNNYISYAQCEVAYGTGGVQRPATVEEKQTCINQQNIAIQENEKNNSINSQRTIFEGLIWGFIFTLVFVFHYPAMKKS